MPLKRQVSDHEFSEAYASPDNTRIINKATSKFRSILDEDERSSCGTQGLWEALQNHEDGKGNKFTSTLYQYVYWRCSTKAKNILKNKGKEVLFTDYGASPEKTFEEQSEIAEIYEVMDKRLSPQDNQILKDYFINKLTIQEIADKNGCSKCTISGKCKRSLEKLRRCIA